MPVIAELHGAMLRDYGGHGAPLLVVPSLINPPNVLDLDAERSLLRWLAGRGHHVLLLDWGDDSVRRSDMSVADHVEAIVVPSMNEIAEPPLLLGYCLGGTMAVAAAALAPARAVATIAAPWHFAGYPAKALKMMGDVWAAAQPSVDALGVLPMEALQSAFWSLDPARTVAKFEAFAEMAPGSPEAQAFVRLEDWANDGPPISAAAAREMFEEFFAADRPGRGDWTVGGRAIDPAALACPQLHIASTSDRIVPHSSAVRSGDQMALAQGHVGMVVGGRARKALWQPLAAWLSLQFAS
ncbi:MAG: alpha/beta hydrolase, partial [Alphaproteobacteria bacterium]|nr:alpha/beta hydrolase [Alphaproteobacteria bacterium]